MMIDREGNETAKSILASKVAPALMSKTITERGTYKASDDGVRGYNEVDVDIPYTDVHVATGAVATFEGENLPLKSLIASIVPVQAGSGDPSPENVRPISGWSGVNVENGGDNIWTGESSYTTAGLIMIFEVFKNNSTSWQNRIYQSPTIYSKDGLNTFSFSLPEEGTNLRIYTDSPSGITLTNVKLFENPSTTTIPFTDGQGQSVEVFGGSVDVVNGGEQPRTIGGVDMGTLAWAGTTNNRFVADLNDVISASGDFTDFMCEIFTPRATFENGSIWINNKKVYVVDTTHSTPTDFTNFVNGKKIVYPLASPTTFNTQPTSIKSLEGNNNIYADTGDVDVEYQTVWVRPTE